MENHHLVLNAYYNRDESVSFLRNILRPLALSWKERGIIVHLFYRRSLGRGEHFSIFLKLNSVTPEACTVLEQELRLAVQQNPSKPPDSGRSADLLFMPFENNSVREVPFDPTVGLGAFSQMAGPLILLAVSGAEQMLRVVMEDVFWPGVAVTLADSVFEGLGIATEVRAQILNSFVQMFVPASCRVGRSREEAFDGQKKLLQGIRRDYAERESEYSDWISPKSQALLQPWASELKMLCGSFAAVLNGHDKGQRDGLQLTMPEATQHLLVIILLGLTDCLLLEESDALATAYRLSRIYQAELKGVIA